MVCHLFKRYRRQNKVLSMPMLIAVLRDFDLDLPESPDDELFKLLKQHKNGEVAFESFRCIKAFPLVKPTERKKLRQLQDMSDILLDPEYVEMRGQLKDFLRTGTKPLCTQSNSPITGKVLVKVLHKIVEAVNDDKLTGMESTFTDLLREQNEKLTKESIEKYEHRIQKEWPSSSTPKPVHEYCQNSVRSDLKEKLFDIGGNTHSFLKQFWTETNYIYDNISEKKSKKELENLNSTIESKYNNGSYFKIGGSSDFNSDMDMLERRFKAQKQLGPKANHVLIWYKQSQATREKTIKAREERLNIEQNIRRQDEERRRLQRQRDEVERERRRIIQLERFNRLQRQAELIEGVLNLAFTVAGLFFR